MFGAGLARGLVRKAVAAAVAAGAALIAVVCLGLAVFFALNLVLPPLAAATITGLLFALIALVVVVIFLRREDEEDDDDYQDDSPLGIGQRAFALFRERPILGTVAALAGGWIVLKNPALATMVAAAFAEKPHGRSRR